MKKPRILVMTAAGKTGMPTALDLRRRGFPVTAFVRQADARAERLRAAGAEIHVGSAWDLNDVRQAMRGCSRAYFCTPVRPGTLRAAATFVTAAQEQRLESVVVMSQWLASACHPSVHTREVWLSDQIIGMLPDTAVTTNNVGFFADNDLQVLPFAAQFGLMMLPYGKGLNAAPSNEDIARVNAALLANPEGHERKSYRPTGPKLLSGEEIAEVVSKVLGRSVQYVNAPIGMVAKVLRGMGAPNYMIAQYAMYAADYAQGAFAHGAPTQDTLLVTGEAPEDYETVTRRYASRMRDAKPSLLGAARLGIQSTLWMMGGGMNLRRFLAADDFSDPSHIRLSSDSEEWRVSHARLVPQAPGVRS